MIKKELRLTFIPCYITICLVEDVVDHRNRYMLKRWPLLGIMKNTNNSIALHTCDEDNYFGHFWITLPIGVSRHIIVHEITHCVDHICETWGFDCTEFRAYMADWLFSEIDRMDRI
jgi:hypothetical protein